VHHQLSIPTHFWGEETLTENIRWSFHFEKLRIELLKRRCARAGGSRGQIAVCLLSRALLPLSSERTQRRIIRVDLIRVIAVQLMNLLASAGDPAV